jgi:hypothetical protein
MKNGVHLALLPEKPKFFVETATLNLRVQGPSLRLVCPFYFLFLCLNPVCADELI